MDEVYYSETNKSKNYIFRDKVQDFNTTVITLKMSYMFHDTHGQFSQNSQMLNSTMCTSLTINSPKQTMNVRSVDRNSGARSSTVGWGTLLETGRTWVSFLMVNGIFHWQSFWLHYGPGVNSASNRNEYQEYFLGVKVTSAYGWQPDQLHVPTFMCWMLWNLGASTSWNPQDLSRPVQGLLYLL